jgi:hypothetical protein
MLNRLTEQAAIAQRASKRKKRKIEEELQRDDPKRV